MPESIDIPELCRQCAGSGKEKIHKGCRFCYEAGFPETIFCDLNRSVQEISGFQCCAFRPALRLVGALEKKSSSGRDVHREDTAERDPFEDLLQSDKIQYQRAVALQKLHQDPDMIIIRLKYHFAWNVSLRTQVFASAKDFIDVVYRTFLETSETARGFVNLLYLAPDHVHVYVESDGERSVDAVANDIKRLSAKTILEKSPSLRGALGADIDLWDEAYFVETIG